MSCNQPANNDDDIIVLPDTINLNFYTPQLEPQPPSTSDRAVKLTWSVSRYNFESTDGIRVRITASDPHLMSAKVFAYLMLPLVPGATERAGAFDHVCSPIDLEEYPENAPIPNSRPAWFRLDYVDVLLRSRAEVEAFIRDVVEDVQRLKATLDVMDTLIPGGSVWVGPPPPEE
jgi:hypothetical protein